LAALRLDLASSGDHEKVLVICRLLFVNPNGWEPPILGRPRPAINETIAKTFPLFPVALSDGTPFLLIDTYELDGLPEPATRCLKLCEGFELVKEDYPADGHEKAARALTQMDSFRQLYEEEDRQQATEMILNQANTKTGEK
jgi:hypothetical protein